MMKLTLPNHHTLDLTTPVIMGILNVTPDSFSDGGQFFTPAPGSIDHDTPTTDTPDTFTSGGNHHETAVGHALAMVDFGAAIIDVGGESTRPGSDPVSPDEQIHRTCPVITRLVQTLARRNHSAAISIDTTSATVAKAAIAAGATIINDVSAGRHDPDMFKLAADAATPLILMHMQGNPKIMQQNPTYDDVALEVKTFLLDRCEAAIAAGVKKENLIIDPGIGFGKTTEHNLTLMANLKTFVDTGYPVLLGASRKRFLGEICNEPDARNRTAATCATTTLGIAAGVQIFRVHDVEENIQALKVVSAVRTAQSSMGACE